MSETEGREICAYTWDAKGGCGRPSPDGLLLADHKCHEAPHEGAQHKCKCGYRHEVTLSEGDKRAQERRKPLCTVRLKANGQGSVVLDGEDISNNIAGVDVVATAGRGTRISLHMLVADKVDIESRDVHLFEGDAELLALLGWAAPSVHAEVQQRLNDFRRSLAGALGHEVELPLWAMIDQVRELKAQTEGMDK